MSDAHVPTVTVVLCVRNGATTLNQQLNALAAQDYSGSWEVVLVDNASNDETRLVAQEAIERIPCIRILVEPRVGLSRARNCGIAAARSAFILLCDADDEASPSWVRAMVEGLQRFDIVGGALSADKLNGSNPMKARCLQRHALPGLLGYEYAVGANLGFQRGVFEAVGGFDEDFAFGFDEVDFCLRAQLGGFSLGFVPAAVVHYRMRNTLRGVVRQRLRYGAGYQRFLTKAVLRGLIRRRLRARWKILAVRAMSLVRALPDALDHRTRLPYVADVAYTAGQVARLTVESVSAPHRTRIWSILQGGARKIDQIGTWIGAMTPTHGQTRVASRGDGVAGGVGAGIGRRRGRDRGRS